MTAVIGILNKQAVAVAADSAVTVSAPNGRKIFNTANKIFTFSKHYPVGVMIYNSASFMSTPWETIIKLYRENLDTRSFNTLDEYIENFISFLKSKSYFTNTEYQYLELRNLGVGIFDRINRAALQNISPIDSKEAANNIKLRIDALIDEILGTNNYCNEFTQYGYEEFVAYSDSTFEEAYQFIYDDNIDLS